MSSSASPTLRRWGGWIFGSPAGCARTSTRVIIGVNVRRWFDANEDRVHPMAQAFLHHRDAGHPGARRRCQVAPKPPLGRRQPKGLPLVTTFKRIIVSMAALAALALAVGAGWRPN